MSDSPNKKAPNFFEASKCSEAVRTRNWMPPEDNNNTSQQRKKRVQLKHLLIDVDFRHKPKIAAMRYQFGQISRLWLLDLLADISRATDARVDRILAVGLAVDLGIESPEELIDFCVGSEILCLDGGKLSNSRVIADQEKLSDTQEEWRRKDREKRERLKGLPGETPESEGGSPPKSVNTERLNTEDLKDLDLNKTTFTPSWTPEGKKALRQWQRHRKQKQKALGPTEIDALISGWSHDVPGFIRAVNFHISNGSKNLYPVADQAQVQPNPSKFPTPSGGRELLQKLGIQEPPKPPSKPPRAPGAQS